MIWVSARRIGSAETRIKPEKGESSSRIIVMPPETARRSAGLEGNFFNGKRVTPNMPFVVSLREDPFERTPTESGQYLAWMRDKLWAFVPAQVIVGQFLQSFREFPPSQKSGSFDVGQALDAIQAASQGGGK